MIYDIVTIRYLGSRKSERENFRDQLSGISASPAKQGPGRSRATARTSYSVTTLTGIYRPPLSPPPLFPTLGHRRRRRT